MSNIENVFYKEHFGCFPSHQYTNQFNFCPRLRSKPWTYKSQKIKLRLNLSHFNDI